MSNLKEPVEVYSYPPIPKRGGGSDKPYEYQEFPRGVFNKNGRDRIVNDEFELAKMIEQGWSTTPFPEPEPVLDTCPNCARIKGKFDSAWQSLYEDHKALTQDHAVLAEDHAGLEAQHAELHQQVALAADTSQKAADESAQKVKALEEQLAASDGKVKAAEETARQLQEKVAAFEAEAAKAEEAKGKKKG